MAWIELHGATEDWSSGEREYVERGPIRINADRIDAYYDHTILATGNKIRVMETKEEIDKCLTLEECGSLSTVYQRLDSVLIKRWLELQRRQRS